MLAPVRTIAPASEPVTLDEAKLHCRVDHDDDDDLIEGLIAAATGYLDGWTGILGRALITQTWRQDFHCFADRMRLSLLPVASITSVTYYDASNEQQTLDDGVYGLFTDGAGPYVGLKPDQTWPGVYGRRDAVSVTYVAGAAEAPAAIKAAMLLMIGHWYANREAASDAPRTALPMAVDALLRPYQAVGV